MAKQWFDMKNVDLDYSEITEIVITDNQFTSDLVPTWDDIWDISSADFTLTYKRLIEDGADEVSKLDIDATCYLTGTKIYVVCKDSFTTIPDKFFVFLSSLKKVSGLNNVTEIGERAFFRCHGLEDLSDLNVSGLEFIGADAFRLSSAEDCFFSDIPNTCVVKARATRSKRWNTSDLTTINGFKSRVPYSTYLPVPNIDCQNIPKYKTIDYVRIDDGPYRMEGGNNYSLYEGCSAFALYHAWNCLHAGTDKEYKDCEDWFVHTLNKDGNYPRNTYTVGGDTYIRDYWLLGWERKYGVQIPVRTADNLTYILDELAKGLPVVLCIKTGTSYHAVLLNGWDNVTGKVSIIDSGCSLKYGIQAWCKLEDLFIGNIDEGGSEVDKEDSAECIYMIDFNCPLLSSRDRWFTKNPFGLKRSDITEIEVTTDYTGNSDTSWDASLEDNGTVQVYVDGTKLTIVYEKPILEKPYIETPEISASLNVLNQCDYGYEQLFLSADSRGFFSDTEGKDYYTELTTIKGITLLNTSRVINMEGMFGKCTSLTSVDVSNMDTSSVTTMVDAFDGMERLGKVMVGEKFNFVDTMLPAPSSNYFPYADGFWYDEDGKAYIPAVVSGNARKTYYATKFMSTDDSNELVFVRNGTLKKIAISIRHKNGGYDAMFPSKFADDILSSPNVENVLSNLYYFESFKTAIDCINGSIDINGYKKPSDNVAAVGYVHNGYTHVVLLQDVEVTEMAMVTADMVLVLNGHTLSCANDVTIILGINGGNVIIDGRTPGSMIQNVQQGSTRASAVVLASGSLIIDGGTYQCNGEFCNHGHGCIMATIDTVITLRNAKILIYGTSGRPVAINLSGNTVIENCEISSTNTTGASTTVKINKDVDVNISNSLISVEGAEGECSTTSVAEGTKLSMNNCKEIVVEIQQN